jgi:serine/threonine protein kinase
MIAFKKRKLNTICGTPNYMAPEVLARKEYVGENADVWAFGVVMYAIAEGRHPFNATNYKELLRTVNRGVFEFVNIVNPVHKGFIKRILKVKPDHRPSARILMSHPWLNIEDQEINMDEVD